MAVNVYAAKSDGWHALSDGSLLGGTPTTGYDLTGFTFLRATGSNARTTIQNALDSNGDVALADLSDGGAANWDCASSILLDSGMQLYVGQGVNLWRNFNSSN